MHSASGALHKLRSPSRGVVQCGYFTDKEGSSESDVRTFWWKKLRNFRNFWCVICMDMGWGKDWASAHVFRTRKGQFFAILCRRNLWTAPYNAKEIFCQSKSNAFSGKTATRM